MEQNLTLAAKLERYEGRVRVGAWRPALTISNQLTFPPQTWASRLSDFCLVIFYGLAALFLASFLFGLLLAEVLFDVMMDP